MYSGRSFGATKVRVHASAGTCVPRYLTPSFANSSRMSYAPGSDWVMQRGKKLMLATTTRGRIRVGVWKELARKRGELIWWGDGQAMALSPEEALDLAYAIGFMAHELDRDVKKKYTRWVARGRRRPPALKIIAGGLQPKRG